MNNKHKSNIIIRSHHPVCTYPSFPRVGDLVECLGNRFFVSRVSSVSYKPKSCNGVSESCNPCWSFLVHFGPLVCLSESFTFLGWSVRDTYDETRFALWRFNA